MFHMKQSNLQLQWYEKLWHDIASSGESIAELERIFYDNALDLLRGYVLVINSLEVQLCEIEFYHYSTRHQDPFVHEDERLRETKEQIYVHKKAWQRGGMGLTFGNGTDRSTILFRGIKCGGEFVAGPVGVKKFVVDKLHLDISDHKTLQSYFDSARVELLKRDLQSDLRVINAPREGLSSKDVSFREALYRFVRSDYLVAKRGESFKSYANLKDRSLLLKRGDGINEIVLKYAPK